MSTRDVVRSSPFTALTVTTAIVVFTIAGLIAVVCVVTSCTRRHHSKTTRPSPRHLATAPGTTTPTGYSAAGYIRSPTLTIGDVRPASFYQSVCGDTVCPTVKSSWASTAVPLSELWSASQIGSRHVPSRAFASRQIQPITLHYYNDF